MYVRLAFAVAVHVDPDLLLVDEVLAVGDEPFQNKCIAKIGEFQKEGRTIVVVSHSAPQIEQLCDRVVVMDHGQALFDGDATEGIRVLQGGYEAEREREESTRITLERLSAKVTNVLIASNEPEKEKVVVPGDDMTVSFNYEISVENGPLVAQLNIETLKGALIYGLSTREVEEVLPCTPGRHAVDFTFKDPALGAGVYVLRGSLETLDGEVIHRLSPGSTFTVAAARPGSGYVRMELETKVRTIPPA